MNHDCAADRSVSLKDGVVEIAAPLSVGPEACYSMYEIVAALEPLL